MIWAYPWVFFSLILIIPFWIWRSKRKSGLFAPIRFSDTSVFKGNWKTRLQSNIQHLYWLALILCVIALARPQKSLSDSRVHTEGIDVMLVLDVSLSMLAKDFSPDRFEAAKEVAVEFIQSRPNDRIGLVIFGEDAFTQCPLTIDHDILIQLIQQTEAGMLNSGTGIGIGLATAVNRLQYSNSKSKVIVLMTDGVNNAGDIDPNLAAQLAQAKDIRVHTIGIGTEGEALSPVSILPNGEFRFGMVKVEIDEKLLDYIASSTDGKYFRATDNAALSSIYAQIDQMEKSRVELSSVSRVEELFHWFVAAALGLICLGYLLRTTVCKTVN